MRLSLRLDRGRESVWPQLTVWLPSLRGPTLRELRPVS